MEFCQSCKNWIACKPVTGEHQKMGNCMRCKKKEKDSGIRYSTLVPPPPEAPTVDMEQRKAMAVSKIQRQARRAKAIKMAKAEQQWKMFADLDTQDEAEMLHLAVFMQTLIDTVPGNEGVDADQLKTSLEAENDDDFMIIKLDSIELKDRAIRADSVRVDPNDYEINQAKIDSVVVAEIIEVYRKGGKLSRKSVVKILRRAYKLLQKQPNITRMTVQESCKLTVVGDLHGQLSDLLHIIDESGLPNANNKFVFNGDFVDRGAFGIEIVCILFAMYIAEGGEVVCMNRGNHEDLPVCRVYGFESEMKEKYDELLFEMCAEVFNFLPLFTLVNDSIFIVHGGLFHKSQVSFEDLEEIDRSDYYVKPPIPYPQNIKGLSAEEARKEYLKQLQRDALWSDPTEEDGCYLNHRGAGVCFGPDIAAEFMKFNKLDMVIRAHECAFRGFELPFAQSAMKNMSLQQLDQNPPGYPLLCTLFSASNYIDGDNEGAFMIFVTHPFNQSLPVGGKSKLHYSVKRYKTSKSATSLEHNNKVSLRELITKKKTALLTAFEAADIQNLGIVSRVDWAEIMQRVTGLKIRWLSIISTVARADSLSPTSVAYRIFLENYNLDEKTKGESSGLDSGEGDEVAGVMDDMYGQRKKLENVFYFFDTNGDGVISLDEFREGCGLLNKTLPPEYQLTNVDHTLKMMDFDGSGTIDINEFFETFRILDAKDGKVDGVISLAQRNNFPRANLTTNAKVELLEL